MVFVNPSRGLGIHTTHLILKGNAGSVTVAVTIICIVLSFTLPNVLQTGKGEGENLQVIWKRCLHKTAGVKKPETEKNVVKGDKGTTFIDPNIATIPEGPAVPQAPITIIGESHQRMLKQ